jgi:hypothetical protein
MTSDSYAALRELVALLADGKATVKRIDQLQKLESEIAKAQAKLDGDRAAHDRATAAAEAGMIAKEQELRRREVDLAGREGMLAVQLQFIDRWKAEHNFADADIQPGSTLRRAAS